MSELFYQLLNKRFARLDEQFVPHTIKWRDDLVAISFHSMMMYQPNGNSTLMYGVRVNPENFWAMYDFSHATPTKAIFKDENGKEWESYCGVVTYNDHVDFRFNKRELRIGADYKYGPMVSSCVRQAGWIETSGNLSSLSINEDYA